MTTFPSRTDDFCAEHGYEHMRSQMGNPIPFCQACEDNRSAEFDRLRYAFRNVDDLDWGHLLTWIPDSGHGRFWKTVFAEARTALRSP